MASHPPEINTFIKLLLEHQSALRAYIVSLMPGSDDAEDVLQNTNVVIWEKMNSFEDGSNFQAWIFAIARNMVKSQFRANKRHHSPSMDDELIQAIDQVWNQRPEKETTLRQRALDRCLEKLKPSDRDLIEVRYSKGKTLEQHAKRIKRSPDSLRTALSRVRAKLRNCVHKRLLLEGDVQ
ncbi:sigma-70 family RNA polymerase sigma factor [Verrucomicrobiaceae bacterium N1E253]|uniref:Sigma-70 family RNA polymerase sigma factor n=1 Tax=Oceaniferula marina TaxID=2748318 RepID=A0A851GLN9_9BACT|nr:sigma-70 family RNA polymerase sigma factor [Oceaniferula marina]NWK55054.1 sigma-70 family RNA polymerase sigma factor [Oceaniferula marina]